MKRWIAACLHNHLIISVIALAICVLGAATLLSTPITPFPPVPSQSIRLHFNYPGANASTVQTQITTKVTDALRSINNIDRITAVSKEGSAILNLHLTQNSSSEMLQTEMKVIQAVDSSHIPSVVPQPKIDTFGTTSGLISFVFTSNSMSKFELGNLIKSALYPQMTTIPYASVNTPGDDPVVRVKLIPKKLAQYQLSASNIAQRIDKIYHSNPLGTLYFNKVPYTLNADADINSLQSIGNIVIGYQGKTLGRPIYLNDIAKISFEPRSVVPNKFYSFNDKTAVSLDLETHSLANPFQVTKLANGFLDKFMAHYGDSLKAVTTFDNAKVSRDAIHDVILTIIVTCFLIVIVAVVFLGRLKTTIIPIITIPICLLGSLAFLNIINYTPSLLTLLAMLIAIGLVVDDAIVVVENITRYIEKGMSKRDAVLNGSANIGKTIIGITATLLAVYTPILFSNWDMAVVFKAFAITLSVAVLLSGIVALTLTPVMAMKLIPDSPPNAYQLKFDHYLARFIALYHRGLKHCLNHPWISLFIIFILLFGAGYTASKVQIKVFPTDYQATATVEFKGGPQDTVATLQAESQKLSPFFDNPMVHYHEFKVNNDKDSGILTARLRFKLKDQYIKESGDFASKLGAFLKKNEITNGTARANNFSSWGGDSDVSLYLYGNSLKDVNIGAAKLTELLNQSPLFSTANNEIQKPKKQIQFDINTVKAAKYGLFSNNISDFLSTYYGGHQLQNYFSIAGLSVPIVVQMGQQDLQTASSLQKLRIKSPLDSKFYPVDEFVSLKTISKPSIINTFNNKPFVQINANLVRGVSISSALATIDQMIQTNMPKLQHFYTGNARNYIDGSSASTMIFLAGILCIYFILALLFKSILDPFIIMLTVPFSILGGILALYLFGGSINLYSALGLITLVGLITKHGVLIVQFANHAMEEKGESIREAILSSTGQRFRPIIMTTLAMTFGVLPLAISSGYMYGARFNLGITIMGGLLVGTLFSLFIVPLVYMLLTQLRMLGKNEPAQ